MRVSIICAVSPSGIIGINNKLPWHIPEDLARFQKLTTGKVVIMGRNTWISLGSKPLPNRKNIIVTSDKKTILDIENIDDVARISYDYYLDSALHMRNCLSPPIDHEVFIIGGAKLFEEGMRYADRVYLTKVNDEPVVNEGDNVVRFKPDLTGFERAYLRRSYGCAFEMWDRV